MLDVCFANKIAKTEIRRAVVIAKSAVAGTTTLGETKHVNEETYL